MRLVSRATSWAGRFSFGLMIGTALTVFVDDFLVVDLFSTSFGVSALSGIAEATAGYAVFLVTLLSSSFVAASPEEVKLLKRAHITHTHAQSLFLSQDKDSFAQVPRYIHRQLHHERGMQERLYRSVAF
jgi:hypothetical protein